MQKHNFDLDWQFKKGDPLTPEWHALDTADWQHIDLPHDWSISLERSPDNPSGTNGGFFARVWDGIARHSDCRIIYAASKS